MDELTARADRLMGGGQWAEAEALLLSAREDARSAGSASAVLSLDSELMGFYRMYAKKERFESAMTAALSALETLRVRPAGRGTILINAATGLVAFGEAERALPYYAEAEACYSRALAAGDFRFAALYNNMAAAYQSLGEYGRAEELMLRAAGVLEGIGHHPDLATTWVNLAQLYTLMGDPGRAESALDRAAAAFDDPEMLWDGYYAHTALKCAGGFEELGRADTAAELRERAEIIYEGS
ncbi:MAG: tetratricopeptide repeat protein [Oscillospiraceae bacterium]|nr:tetratricopeptide repeat protein [Oscillospiraceae bacterium]